MKKRGFELGADVEEALRALAGGAQGEEVPAEEAVGVGAAPAKRPVVPAAPIAGDDALLTWYRAMRPRTMGKLLWMIFFRWQARRSGGVIVPDELAALLGLRRDKVSRALSELSKAGWITVTHVEYGARRSVRSKTIEFSTPQDR